MSCVSRRVYSGKQFASLLFASTRLFRKCAEMISHVCGCTMESRRKYCLPLLWRFFGGIKLVVILILFFTFSFKHWKKPTQLERATVLQIAFVIVYREIYSKYTFINTYEFARILHVSLSERRIKQSCLPNCIVCFVYRKS